MYAPKLSPEVLRVWLRQVLPDLRLGKALDEHGARVALAKFTLQGEEVVLDATGEDADDALVEKIGNVARQVLGLPLPTDSTQRDAAEQAIVEAAANGQPEHADRLARELVLRNARAPRMLNASTRIGVREIW